MAAKSSTFIDVEKSIYEPTASLSAAGSTVTKSVLHGGLSEGVDVIKVDNGKFSFIVLPTRGMNIWKAWTQGDEIGWKSPVRGPVHPMFVPLNEPSGLGWLDGFDELLARCGLESNGAPEFDGEGRVKYPLHGRIGNKPAQHVSASIDDESGEVTLTGVVEESRFHFFKLRLTTVLKTRPGEAGFRLQDTVHNFSASDGEAQMLYHWNFGQPLLDAGAQFVAPLKTVVPRNEHAASGMATWNSYAGEQTGFEEQVYFMELLADANDDSQVLLKNAHGTKGVSLAFNKRSLPCFTVWKNTTAAPDGYVTGLEPGTNFPNPRSHEGKQGRVARLPAGGSVTFHLSLQYLSDEKQVAAAEDAVKALQGDTKPRIFESPQEGWCA